MPKYRVYFHQVTISRYEIDAESKGAAQEAALDRFENEETPSYHVSGGDFEIVSVEEITA